jgi:hypothetical protein
VLINTGGVIQNGGRPFNAACMLHALRLAVKRLTLLAAETPHTPMNTHTGAGGARRSLAPRRGPGRRQRRPEPRHDRQPGLL